MENIYTLLEAKRQIILEEWINALNAVYPLESIGLMRSQKNSFANPIGKLNSTATNYLFNLLVGKEDLNSQKVRESLEELIALRAIQDMSASQALAGVIVIKSILNKHIIPSLDSKEQLQVYLNIIDQIDALILLSLDLYDQSKEKVFRIRVDEVKKAQAQVLKYVQKKDLSAE